MMEKKTSKHKKLDAIKRLLKNREYATVLDIGAGDGNVSKELKHLNPSAYFLLIDNNKQELQKATDLNTRLSTFEDFETDEQFELVLLVQVLEHFDEYYRCLTKAIDLLKPNGTMLILVPCMDFPFKKKLAWIYRKARYKSKAAEIEREHKQILSSKEVIQDLERNGLAIETILWKNLWGQYVERQNPWQRLTRNAVLIMAKKEGGK